MTDKIVFIVVDRSNMPESVKYFFYINISEIRVTLKPRNLPVAGLFTTKGMAVPYQGVRLHCFGVHVVIN